MFGLASMNYIFFVVQVQRVWDLLWPCGARRCFRFLRELRDLASLRHGSTANFFLWLYIDFFHLFQGRRQKFLCILVVKSPAFHLFRMHQDRHRRGSGAGVSLQVVLHQVLLTWGSCGSASGAPDLRVSLQVALHQVLLTWGSASIGSAAGAPDLRISLQVVLHQVLLTWGSAFKRFCIRCSWPEDQPSSGNASGAPDLRISLQVVLHQVLLT